MKTHPLYLLGLTDLGVAPAAAITLPRLTVLASDRGAGRRAQGSWSGCASIETLDFAGECPQAGRCTFAGCDGSCGRPRPAA